MKFVVYLCVLFLVAYGNAANNNCYVLGVEGTVPFPPVGYTTVTLSMLQGAHAPAFIAQYNTYGINFISNDLVATNCLATLGEYGCVYPRGIDTSDFLVPFTFSGLRQCIWNNPVGPVKFGTWDTNTYYPTMNTSVINSWVTITCPTTNYHYTLLYNSSCGSNPTPPPSGASTCCYYFSHPENYQTFLCQKSGIACPDVSGFVLVYNQTVSSCDKCALSAVPDTIQHKYSSIQPLATALLHADKPDKE